MDLKWAVQPRPLTALAWALLTLAVLAPFHRQSPPCTLLCLTDLTETTAHPVSSCLCCGSLEVDGERMNSMSSLAVMAS